jgi:hypothetical protein
VVVELNKFGSQNSTRTKYLHGARSIQRGSYVCTVRTAYIRVTRPAVVASVRSTCPPSWKTTSRPRIKLIPLYDVALSLSCLHQWTRPWRPRRTDWQQREAASIQTRNLFWLCTVKCVVFKSRGFQWRNPAAT